VARKGGLGKGLGALIPPGAGRRPRRRRLPGTSSFDHPAPTGTSRASTSARSSSARSRTPFARSACSSPWLVRPADDGYELIAGERRWRAARRAGLQAIPALIKTTDDASALEHALVENVHRADLNALEEAAAYSS